MSAEAGGKGQWKRKEPHQRTTGSVARRNMNPKSTAVVLKTCEYIRFGESPIGQGAERVWPRCGRPATHLWTPRTKKWQKPVEPMPVCEFHGHVLAGNFLDELTEILK